MTDKPLRVKAVAKIKPPKPIPKAQPKLTSEAEADGIDDLLAFPLYDLREGSGLSAAEEHNVAIVEMLNRLIDFTLKVKAVSTGKEKADHQRRIASFIRARDAIIDYNKPIKSGYQAQKDIEGVGKGIATRIQEFLNTGQLAELQHDVEPEAKLIMDLCEISGIGEVTATALVSTYDLTSVADLISKFKAGKIKVGKGQLTHHMAVGIRYYEDLKLRMPWAEADQIATAIKANVDKDLIVEICGSYRRHRPTCGDIDVLISRPPSTTAAADATDPSPLPAIVTQLEKAGILVDHLTTKGETKYMGICMGPSGIGRRIDIRYVDYASLGAAMLYFTGSGKFNKIMRYHANSRGYTLNEYGLYHYVNMVKGDMIPAPTEEDIFRILRFVYLTPIEREF